MRAVRGRHAHARGRRRLEHAERLVGDRQHLGLAVGALGDAGDRLDARALGEARDPRRPAAGEREVVLPGHPAGARDAQGEQLVEQLAHVVVAAGPELVELGEVGERVDHEALAREVLPDELGAGEGDAAGARPDGVGRPVRAVALERQPQRHEPRAGQRPAGGDALDGGHHTREFVAPRAAPREPLDGALDGLVGREAVGPLEVLDRACGGQSGQLARHGPLFGRALRGGRGHEQQGNQRTTHNSPWSHPPNARLAAA